VQKETASYFLSFPDSTGTKSNVKTMPGQLYQQQKPPEFWRCLNPQAGHFPSNIIFF
jgi:hypothetical protein